MLSSRATSCLLGGALGDALGYPVEFVSSGAAIVRALGENPPARLPRCDDGEVHVSDDTQMTLFTAEGLALARESRTSPLDAVHAAYQRWLYTQQPTRFDRPAGERAAPLRNVRASLVDRLIRRGPEVGAHGVRERQRVG